MEQVSQADILNKDPALAKIVRRLVQAYQPERIYLFGSMARGDAGPDSDYDLLVVVADVVVWTHSRFERRKHIVCSLPATVLREGRLLHAVRS